MKEKMKKFGAWLLAAALAFAGATANADAVKTTDEFKTAIANAKSGDVITLAAGEFDASATSSFGPLAGKTVSIIGAGREQTTILWGSGRQYNMDGAKLTFKDLAIQTSQNFNGQTKDYTDAFERTASETYENVAVKGRISVVSALATFSGCTFDGIHGEEYLLWVYAGKAVVDGCTFKTCTKAPIKCFADLQSNNPMISLEVKGNTKFEVNGSKGCAVYSSNRHTETIFDVRIDESTVTPPTGATAYVKASEPGVSVYNGTKDESGKYVSGTFMSANSDAATAKALIEKFVAEGVEVPELVNGQVVIEGGEEPTFSGNGSGTAEDPYQIATIAQLKEVNNAPDKNYVLVSDLVVTEEDLIETVFWGKYGAASVIDSFTGVLSGTFEGKRHKISFDNEIESDPALITTLDGTLKDIEIELSGWIGIVCCTSVGPALFDNVTASGWMTVDGNYGAYLTYASSAVTFKNCTSEVLMSGVGGNTDYNAIFIGYATTSELLTFKNCVNEGAIECGRASMFLGNMASYTIKLAVENCANNGTVRSTYVADDFKMNWYYSITGNNYEDFVVNGVSYGRTAEYSAADQKVPSISEDTVVVNTGIASQGPLETGMEFYLNPNGTFRVIPATDGKISGKDVARYEVASGLYVGIPGGSSRFYAREFITVDGSDKYDSVMEDLAFVDATFVDGGETTVVGENRIFTKDGVSYYVIGDNESLAGRPNQASNYYLSAYDANGKLLASVQLAGPTPIPGVAKIVETSKEYPTLQAAIDAVPADGTETTIKMIADDSYTGKNPIAIAAGKKVVIDLNGFTVSYVSDNATNESDSFIANKGDLTVTDTSEGKLGKITAKQNVDWDAGAYTINNSGNYETASHFVLEAGTIENTSAAGLAWPINNGVWGTKADTVINGGTIHSVNYVPVRQYLQYGGSKKLVINGGTFVSDNSRAIAVQFNDASVQEGEASVIINGGDFSCNGSGILYMDLHAANLDTTGLHYEVNGGKFKNANISAPVVVYDNEGHGQDSAVLVKKFITGGIYCAKPADVTIADGYAAVENTDPDTSETYPWMVGEVAAYVAEIVETGVKYPTLQAAVNAAAAGDTVRMLCDATENASIDIEKNLTIDLAGTTLTFAQYGNRIGDDALVTFKDGDIAFAKGGAVPTYGAAFHLRGELTLDTVEIKIENCADYAFDALFHIQASNEGEKDTRLVTLNLNNSKIDLSATAASKSIIDAFQGYTQGRDGAVVHVNMTNTKVKMSYCGYFAQYVAQMNLDNSMVEIDNAQEIVSNNNGMFTLVNASSIAVDTCVSHALTGVKLAVNAGSKIDVKNAAYLGINVGDGSVFKAGSIIRAADCCMTDDVGMTGYHNKDIAIRANGKLTIEAGADVICDGVATTVDGASLDIAGGCFKEVTAGGTGTISLSGGVYVKEPNHGYAAEGYEVQTNAEPFTKDNYPYAVAKKAFVPVDEQPITIDITPAGGTQAIVPVTVSEYQVAAMVEKGIIAEPKEGEKPTAAEVSEGLAKKQDNDQTVWQNYVMGVDGTNEKNVLATIGEKKADTVEEVVVVKTPIAEFNPPQNTGVTVTYNLLRKRPGETKFSVFQEGLLKPEFDVNTIELELGDTLWKFEAVFSAAKPK